MMRRTTRADRQQIVVLKKAGESHQSVSTKIGWSVETVRKVWYEFQRTGETSLSGAKVGRTWADLAQDAQ